MVMFCGRMSIVRTEISSQRVNALLAQMTLADKIGQLTQIQSNRIAPADARFPIVHELLRKRVKIQPVVNPFFGADYEHILVSDRFCVGRGDSGVPNRRSME
jgi:hypothetical protein